MIKISDKPFKQTKFFKGEITLDETYTFELAETTNGDRKYGVESVCDSSGKEVDLGISGLITNAVINNIEKSQVEWKALNQKTVVG